MWFFKSSKPDKEIEDLKNELNKIKINYIDNIGVLKSEIKLIKKQNRDLEEKLREQETVSADISKQKIELYVDNLLRNPNINAKYFPDGIEKKLYTNVITMIMSIVEKSIEDININFMGHELSFVMKPIVEEQKF